MSLNIEILSKAATQARGLCMDAVQASQSGHLGLPLGCAEMGAVLYGYALKYNPAEPRWNYAAYHARRDGARGFTNYNPYGFQAVYPQPVPLIPDEGAKPGDYGGDSQFANLMGRHAAIGWGGTFHSQEGVESRPFSPTTLSCAIAFFRGLTTL